MTATIPGTGSPTFASPLEEASGGTGQTTAIPFKEGFTSAEQTITAAGLLTIAHGLSASPSLIQVRLICKTAEFGFAVDDEVIINPAGNDIAGTSNRGLSVVLDATNVNIRYGDAASPITILRKDTGAATGFTLANWKLVVRAWA